MEQVKHTTLRYVHKGQLFVEMSDECCHLIAQDKAYEESLVLEGEVMILWFKQYKFYSTLINLFTSL